MRDLSCGTIVEFRCHRERLYSLCGANNIKREDFFMNKTKTYVYMGVFIALNIILTRFLSVRTTFVSISFGFIPVALTGRLFGPMHAGVMAGASDIIGTFILPQGAYFPGFTVGAVITGVIYGTIFYKRHINIKNIILAVVIVNIFVNMGLDTLCLSILYGKAFMVIIGARIIKDLIMIPIQTFLIYVCIERILGLVKLRTVNNI